MIIHVITARESFATRIDGLLGDAHTVEWQGPQATADLCSCIAEAGASVAIIGADLDAPDALDIAVELDRRVPATSVVMMADFQTELLSQALRAGVRDIVGREPTDEQLTGSLQLAIELVERRDQAKSEIPTTASVPSPSSVITITSAKGGVGKTAFATNLAIALAVDHPDEVVLMDLDLQFGDVAYALGVNPEATIDEVLVDDRPLSITRMKPYLSRHRTGLYALYAPRMPADADLIKPEAVASAIELLSEQFRFVVIDTSAGMGEVSLTAAESASLILLVATNEIPAIQAIRKQSETLRLIGLDHIPQEVVLNRADTRVGLNAADVTRTVGLPVVAELPSSRSIPITLNKGTPVVESDQRNGYAKAVWAFAERWRTPVVAPRKRGLLGRSVDGAA